MANLFLLQEEPDQEFWGFQVEFDPFEILSPVHLEPFSPTRFDERIYLTLSYHRQKIRSICIGPSKIGSLFGQLIVPTCVAQFALIFTYDRAFVFQWLPPGPCPRSVYPVSLPIRRLRSS